ncbi:MAG TPA: MBL fold metallo-hydrolase [Allosphingosinicella sp.]|jgi:glyoxylase-like metal-dependent hydrolase (beta-lactamase superfamily II)|nr:MBL fold metallo-hydrolase [Allosphingosinicella sp.]
MRRSFIALALALAAAPVGAQQDFSKVEVRVEKLAPGVAVLFGAGGNIGLSYGQDGNVIIDDQFAPLTERINAAIRTIDPDPVRFVINTHWHFDHTGGNENFGRAGAVIIAHDNVRQRMSTDQVMAAINEKVSASPGVALPVVTFGDGVTLHLNGDTLHVVHVANAHTDGDSIVHWQNANVLHMGDTFFHRESFPFIDLDSGGSIDGVIAAAEKGLQASNEQTRIIPGHGPVATRAELAAYRAMLVDIRGKVAAGIAAKRTLAQIQASKPAARYGMPDGFIKPDRFVEFVYNSLRAAPAKGPTRTKRHRH